MQNMGTALQSTNCLFLLQKSDIVLHLLLTPLFLHQKCTVRTTKAAAAWLFSALRHWCMYIFPSLSCKIFFFLYFPKLNCCLIVGKQWKVLSILVSASRSSTCCRSNLVSLNETFQVIKKKEFLVPMRVWSCQVFFLDIPPDWAPGFFQSSINNCSFIFLWKYLLRLAQCILWFDGL